MKDKIIIGNAEIVSIRVLAEGNLTCKWKEEDRVLLDDNKLSIGGLHIEKDGRTYWCDTSIDEVYYDELRDQTIIDLDLWDDPDGMPSGKQDLTGQDLRSNPEFYLWMEHESEMMPKYSVTIESSKRKGYSMQETMEFVRDHFLQWELIGHHTDHDAYLEFHNYRNSTYFCKYPYADEGSLIEGIQFIMDMHYRKEAEEKAHVDV